MSRPEYLQDRPEQLLEKKEVPAYGQLADIWVNLRHIIKSRDIIKKKWCVESAKAPQLKLGDLESFGD
jgi:hypothetical protein